MINWEDVREIERVRESGNPAAALNQLSELKEKCCNNEERSSLLLHDALCYCDLGRFVEATEAADTAVRLLPENSSSRPFAEFSAACVAERKGELERAAQQMRSLLRRHVDLLATPEYISLRRDAQHRLAAILITLGQAVESLSLISDLKAQPVNSEEAAELQYREAMGLRLLGRNDSALKLFQEASAGPLESQLRVRAHFHSGEILFERSNFQRALREFRSAMGLAGDDNPEQGVILDWIRATTKAIRAAEPLSRS